MGVSADEAVQESMALGFGGFLARAARQAEAKGKEQQALAHELAQVKEQMANQARRFFIQEPH